MAKAKCPRERSFDAKARCPPGCKKIVYEQWVADPTAEARNDPNEICTIRDKHFYRRGFGPQPPAHHGCRCKRIYAYHYCRPGKEETE